VPAEPEPEAPPAPAARRIAVVDDNRDAADSMAAILRLQGFEARTGYNGREALSLAMTFHPHAMLLDIGMPDMSGYEVASAVRRLPEGSDIVLVALTGWGQPDDRLRSGAAGFDHHLVKPVNPSILRRLLASPELARA
jgi:CheY-like chemotaxis protein